MQVWEIGGMILTLICSFSGIAQADATLWAGPVSSTASRRVVCQAINVSKKTIPSIAIAMYIPPSSDNVLIECMDVEPDAGCTTSSTGELSCKFLVGGAGKKAVRASIAVENSADETILFLEAK